MTIDIDILFNIYVIIATTTSRCVICCKKKKKKKHFALRIDTLLNSIISDVRDATAVEYRPAIRYWLPSLRSLPSPPSDRVIGIVRSTATE